jgi:hypothetical protein
MGTRQELSVLVGALFAATSACSSPESLSPSGGSCLMTTDCQMGLVCLVAKNVCSADLSSLVMFEDAGGGDASTGDGSTDSSPSAEANVPEGYAVQSEGGPAETGSPVPDATQPPEEAAGPMSGPDSSAGPEGAPNDVATAPAEAAE